MVLADYASGWADLGNPARVMETLERNSIEPDWLREMKRSNLPRRVNVQVPVGHERALAVMRNVTAV